MPYKRLTHEQCRFRVCFVCGNEEGKRNQLCDIGMGDAKLIKEHILSDFTTLYSSNLRRRQTRSEAGRAEEDCTCCVCVRAKLNGGALKKFKKESGELKAAEKENRVPGAGRPLKLCKHCYASLYPGCPHECEASRQVCKSAVCIVQPFHCCMCSEYWWCTGREHLEGAGAGDHRQAVPLLPAGEGERERGRPAQPLRRLWRSSDEDPCEPESGEAGRRLRPGAIHRAPGRRNILSSVSSRMKIIALRRIN